MEKKMRLVPRCAFIIRGMRGPIQGLRRWAKYLAVTGFKRAILDSRPTAKNLQQASIYLIVDPDTEKETHSQIICKPRMFL
jgi:hypothetical protein